MYAVLFHLEAVFDLIYFDSVAENGCDLLAIGRIETKFQKVIGSALQIDEALGTTHHSSFFNIQEYGSVLGRTACYDQIFAIKR